VIDLKKELANAVDSMRVNSQFVSSEIDESDLQLAEQNEQRI
jgi:hypothetical protein